MAGPAGGNVTISIEECKGCGLCVESCPPKCLFLAPELSAYGVHPAHYAGHDCTGCGICFYCCPEPGAITVYRQAARRSDEVARESRPLSRERLAPAHGKCNALEPTGSDPERAAMTRGQEPVLSEVKDAHATAGETPALRPGGAYAAAM